MLDRPEISSRQHDSRPG